MGGGSMSLVWLPSYVSFHVKLQRIDLYSADK